MSYTFSLSGIKKLNYTDTIKSLKVDNVILLESSNIKEDALWPQGYTHIYMENVSTRPLEPV